MWHYALVIGYDQTEQKVILHTGETQAHKMSYELFERVWQRGNYWILALLRAEQTYQYLDAFIYTQSAYDMLTIGLTEPALIHLSNATKVWPKKWLSYFLLGNHYLNLSDEAAKWFSKGFDNASTNPEYLNNYGYALAQEGCITAAKKLITTALSLSPDDQNLLATKNEFDLIITSTELSQQKKCASYSF
jgi:tetratricopeptide (TPR) repeat protein